MISRIKFNRTGGMYACATKPDVHICCTNLREWVGSVGWSKIIHLCFSDKPHSKRYAYEYVIRNGMLRIFHGDDYSTAPFMDSVDRLLTTSARKGLIPKKGWGWVEYEK